uniref:Uncharacterized protein n=1 Tax=Peronospora matthiolae TaxID=2874970 RepID=A0AAV1U8Y2_9STRA
MWHSPLKLKATPQAKYIACASPKVPTLYHAVSIKNTATARYSQDTVDARSQSGVGLTVYEANVKYDATSRLKQQKNARERVHLLLCTVRGPVSKAALILPSKSLSLLNLGRLHVWCRGYNTTNEKRQCK